MNFLNESNDKHHIVYEQEISQDILNKRTTKYRTTE